MTSFDFLHRLLIICLQSSIQNASVNHSGTQVIVAQEFLNAGDIHTGIEQPGGQSMAQLMRGYFDVARGLSQSDECRATVKFVPHSYSSSSVIEPGKDVTIFNAKKATVNF